MAMYSPLDTPCGVGFPILTLPDQSLLPAPRHFSQAATSFIASDRQGIHRVRLFACPYNPKSPREHITSRREYQRHSNVQGIDGPSITSHETYGHARQTHDTTHRQSVAKGQRGETRET